MSDNLNYNDVSFFEKIEWYPLSFTISRTTFADQDIP